jgi:hypothetical protein
MWHELVYGWRKPVTRNGRYRVEGNQNVKPLPPPTYSHPGNKLTAGSYIKTDMYLIVGIENGKYF